MPGKLGNLFHADHARGWFAFLLAVSRKPERGSITIKRFAVHSARRRPI